MARRLCGQCLTPDLKEAILGEVTDTALRMLVEEIPECGLSGKGGGQKRAPSAYNTFIGECMKTKPIKGKGFGAAAPFMKQCAAEWKAQKGQ